MKLTKTSVRSFVGDVLSLGVSEAEGEVFLTCSDASLARVRALGGGMFLIILTKEGDGTLTVTAGEERKTVPLRVRPAFVSDPQGPFRVYCGDLHTHTSYSDGSLTPYDAFRQVKEEGILDFFTISDHAELEDDTEFFRTFDAAESICADGSLIAFPGCESEIDLFGKNAIGGNQNDGGEIVTVNTEGYSWAADWDTFFSQIGTNPLGFASIAHPQVMGGGFKCIWNAFDLEHATTERTRRLIHGIETYNEKGESNLVNERAYSVALDCGYRISPIGGSDNHSPVFGKKMCYSMTFLYAEKKSKDAFLDAFRNARTYCAENANVRLWYTANGFAPASTLPLTDTYTFEVDTAPYFEDRPEDRTVLAEVISDYGTVLASERVDPTAEHFSLTVHSDTARYFYLRLFDARGRRTWSSPVFCGREYDPCPKAPFTGRAIPADGFSVCSATAGTGAENVLIPDPTCCYVSEKTEAELTVDMGRVRTLRGVGIFHNIYDPTIDESKYFHYSHAPLYAKMVSRYEIETSADGVTYLPAQGAQIRLFGCEHVAAFAPRAARYVRFRALASVGADGRNPAYQIMPVSIGTLRFYE